MKIQHIRRDGKLIGTLVAIKDEKEHEVRVGFSVVMNCDQARGPKKTEGVQRALGRALKKRNNKIPAKIEPEFREFVSHLAGRSEYDGFKVPTPNDFDFTYEPLHQHGPTYSRFLDGWI